MADIEIVSGFLGAGKTTWIKKDLKEAHAQEKCMLIENEFGQIGVDAGFLKEAGVQITELNSGCICCTLVGDFVQALQKAVEQYSPDLILIEPSGVGKLSDILGAAERASEGAELRIRGSLTIVDAKKAKMYARNFKDFFADQIRFADVVVLSHTQGLPAGRIEEVRRMALGFNPHAHVVTSEWDSFSAQKVEDLLEKRDPMKEELLAQARSMHAHHPGGQLEHGHAHGEHAHGGEGEPDADDVFDSWGAETGKQYSRESLQKVLEAIRDEDAYAGVLRAKGIVAGSGGKWLHFDYVPGEIDVHEGPADCTGRICVIGTSLPKEELSRLFESA